MEKGSSNYDIFISYTESDKSWAKSLSRGLSKEGYKVYFDREKIKADEDIWEKTFNALYASRYIIYVISKNGLIANWEQMEVIAEIWQGLLNRKKKSFIISLSELKVPALIKQSKFIDGQDDGDIDEIIEEISEIIKPVKAAKAKKEPVVKTLKEDILKSLKIKLKFSFFIPNPFREHIDKIYDQFTYNDHLQIVESKSINTANYFLSYWGWKAARLLIPELFKGNARKNAGLIHSQFAKKTLLELPLQKPSTEFKFVKSIKHTLWAVEMLLLLESNLDFVAEIIENLNENSHEYMNDDGGWKDYYSSERPSSLITSLYAFTLFSKIERKMTIIDIPQRQRKYLKQIISQTEKFILDQWETRKWEFSNLHWHVSAINLLIQYAPFCNKPDALKKIIASFYDLINEKGELVNPLIGTEFYLSGYIISLRLLYALNLAAPVIKKKVKFNKLHDKVMANYSHGEFMYNHDIFFLAELLGEERNN
jgi:hypothetical protein